MSIEKYPNAEFDAQAPEVLSTYLGGYVYFGPGRVKPELVSETIAPMWLAAYERNPELFEGLWSEVPLPAGNPVRRPKHDRAVADYFRREAGGDDIAVAEALFDVDPRHAASFHMENGEAFAVMLAYSVVPIELVLGLRETTAGPFNVRWPSGVSVGRYRPAEDYQARYLTRVLTSGDKAYSLWLGGVSLPSVVELHRLAISRTGQADIIYGIVMEASFLGVPAPYSVACLLAGAKTLSAIVAAFRNNIAPEYLTSVTD